MKLLLRSIFLSIITISVLSSCSPRGPYEMKSPCVSKPSENPYYRNPCMRKPLNQVWDIV